MSMLKIIKDNHKLLIFITLLSIFIFGVFLRYKNIQGNNLVFDYDQIEDQFYTYKLAIDHNPLIIGRAIYGDPRLHHGVFYYYYNLIPFLLSKGNIFASVYWNIFFNSTISITIFFLVRSIFKKDLPALISAFIAACSFEIIKFSNWLTIDTISIFLLPLFYLGLWKIHQGKKWGFILAPFSLGLAMQADISFTYLLPMTLIFWIIFRPKFSSFKLPLLSFFIFIATISTLILTEIKLNFIGVKTLLNLSALTETGKLSINDRILLFSGDFFRNFSNNFSPQRADLGIYFALGLILIIIYHLFFRQNSRNEKQGIYFLLLYLFSPAIVLTLIYHDKPWFLIGLPPAIAAISGFVISKYKYFLIIPILFMIGFSNTKIILERPNQAYKLFDTIYDSTSDLSDQLKVVDYVYQNSANKPFAINAVTYPLYYNGLWAYLFNFYGKNKYGFVPSWLGGDQLHPYDLLPKSKGEEKVFYMLISETPRIPDRYKKIGRLWALENGNLLEEKSIGGFTVLRNEKP